MRKLSKPDFDRFYRHHRPLVERVVAARIPDSHLAEDIVQETFTRALQNLRTMQSERADAWLARVALNLCADHWRSHGREVALESDALASIAPTSSDPFDLVVERQEARRVSRTLASLPKRYRKVLVLRHFLRLRGREIAASEGVSAQAIRSVSVRAKRAFAAAYLTLLRILVPALYLRNRVASHGGGSSPPAAEAPLRVAWAAQAMGAVMVASAGLGVTIADGIPSESVLPSPAGEGGAELGALAGTLAESPGLDSKLDSGSDDHAPPFLWGLPRGWGKGGSSEARLSSGPHGHERRTETASKSASDRDRRELAWGLKEGGPSPSGRTQGAAHGNSLGAEAWERLGGGWVLRWGEHPGKAEK